MIKFENTISPSPEQWKSIIFGTRNAMESWDKSDSRYAIEYNDGRIIPCKLGKNDLTLMKKLTSGGACHATYRRMIQVYCDVTAPLYWWKEADRYRMGKEQISCSTMHRIAAKEFTLDDFSHEHLFTDDEATDFLEHLVSGLNYYRTKYLETKDKTYWWQLIQLLPSSYNQRRTLMLSYECLSKIYAERKDHKLDEWRDFCAWIETLPYSELITGKEELNEQ